MDDASGGDPDRISALPDELLHLILGFLPEATAAARTAVLSRRWRHVWVHARNLVLSDIVPAVDGYVQRRCRARPGYFAGFVDGLFARRGDAGVGSLQIHLWNHRCTPPEKAGEWTRYAVRHAADSFILRVTRNGTATTIELPSHGRPASIWLHLSGNELRLPAPTASMYAALAELVLDAPRFSGDRGRALGDFVSACCPRLRRLDIRSPVGLLELVLAGVDALEELHLSRAVDLRTLDATAPNLRVLQMDRCFRGRELASKGTCRVVAPRLQVIGVRDMPLRSRSTYRPDLDIHGLASVRRLSDLYLDMHGRRYHDTSAGVWLLEKCPRIEHVEVSLDHCRCEVLFPDVDELIDLAPEGAAPFGSVISLKVDATSFPDRQLVAGISSLLFRCPRLTSLSISCELPNSRRGCDCGDIENHPKFSLGSLEEVEISGFRGTKEGLDLVSMLFESSSSIKRMTLLLLTRAAKNIGSQSWKVMELPFLKQLMMDGLDPLVEYEKLKSITCNSVRGRWDIEEGVYTWTYFAGTEVQADGSIAN